LGFVEKKKEEGAANLWESIVSKYNQKKNQTAPILSTAPYPNNYIFP
jgi:hypothetical protein